MHQCSSLDYLDASSKLAAKSNRALSAVFARQASLLFFSLNVLCLLLMAKALPVKRWGAMGGTMNDIGRWSLKAFAPNISRRSLLDKVSVVSNRKPCGVWEFNHSTRYVGFLLSWRSFSSVVVWQTVPRFVFRRFEPVWLFTASTKSGLTKKITVPSEVTDFEPGDPTNQLVFWVYFDKLFLQEWADKPQPHHLTIDQLASIWGGCCTKKSSESSSYGILQFSHPKKNPGFWRVCMCVDVQDNQPRSGTYPIDRSILMDFTPSSQRGMWNAVTLGGFVHFPAT